jgi:hypothetical protein
MNGKSRHFSGASRCLASRCLSSSLLRIGAGIGWDQSMLLLASTGAVYGFFVGIIIVIH